MRLAGAYPVRTQNERRIDQEIGDGNGFIDPQERAVAAASRAVYEATGINVRPRLHGGGYEPAGVVLDSFGPHVEVPRTFTPEQIPFMIFHEAGHIANGDAYYGDGLAQELRATEYAGRLFAATGYPIAEGLAYTRSEGEDALHGPREGHTNALWAGYVAGGGR
jgi:hypothetical protein